MSRTYRGENRLEAKRAARTNRRTRKVARALEDTHTYRKVALRVNLRKLTEPMEVNQ
jgi:hypothetical protein